MILLCLIALAAPPVAPPSTPTSAAPASTAAPIDWANHDYGLFTLRDGSAEMREYPMDGAAHDSQRWRLARVEPVEIAGARFTIVLIGSAYSAPGISRESLTAYLFKGETRIGEVVTVPTESARITQASGVLMGRWRVGAERFVERWRITDKGLMSMGRPATLRPR